MKNGIYIAILTPLVLVMLLSFFGGDIYFNFLSPTEPAAEEPYIPVPSQTEFFNGNEEELFSDFEPEPISDTERRRQQASGILVGQMFGYLRQQTLESGSNINPWEAGIKSWLETRFDVPMRSVFFTVDENGVPTLKQIVDPDNLSPAAERTMYDMADYLSDLMRFYRADIAERFDKNGDGIISEDEAKAYADETEERITNGTDLGEQVIDAYRRQIQL